MPDLTPAQLHDVVTQTCSALGSADREAALVADQLVGANLAGHDSHGIGMLPLYVAHALTGELHVNEHVEVLNDTGPLVALDGRAGFGQVMGYEAMEIGIDRARQHGVSLVGLRNSFHIGGIGHWAEQCSAAGLVSLHLVNVAGHGAIVAPFGGASARLGTNPVCIGIPGRDGRPAVMLDMATSTIALGKARVALNKGERVPADTVVDANGNLSDDPSEVIGPDHGGSARGNGRAQGVRPRHHVRTRRCCAAGRVHDGEQDGPGRIYNSMVTVVIDPEAVGGAEHLLAETEATVEWLRSGRARWRSTRC
ncbi:MAG: Ldh family oxidoreductase [Acidimicrobiales bacterium]